MLLLLNLIHFKHYDCIKLGRNIHVPRLIQSSRGVTRWWRT